MKQKLFIFLVLIFVAVLLLGLNAATYVQREKMPDSETLPNRSTYNAGATGTRAFYTLLVEAGHKVTRWQEPPSALLSSETPPAVFVIVGRVRREFTAPEAASLLSWVSGGGRLVIIDREPPSSLITTTSPWKLDLTIKPDVDLFTVDPSDQKQMIGDAAAAKPVQPTLYTQGVNSVQPSKFAATIKLSRENAEKYTEEAGDEDDSIASTEIGAPSPTDTAPIIHFARNLVVETEYGDGRIVIVADPYIVSNNGIALVDNAQAAVNFVAVAGDGVIAFDEYHQGYGSENGQFIQFFSGTPVIAIFLQTALLIGLVFYSQSRRFARAVPEPEADRLSKLEYVTAMAELQGRFRAFDLAIENIYAEFRRRAARLFGLDVKDATSDRLAPLIAGRTALNSRAVYDTLHTCEEIIRGEATNSRLIVRLTNEVRSIERKLGIARDGRPKR